MGWRIAYCLELRIVNDLLLVYENCFIVQNCLLLENGLWFRNWLMGSEIVRKLLMFVLCTQCVKVYYIFHLAVVAVCDEILFFSLWFLCTIVFAKSIFCFIMCIVLPINFNWHLLLVLRLIAMLAVFSLRSICLLISYGLLTRDKNCFKTKK